MLTKLRAWHEPHPEAAALLGYMVIANILACLVVCRKEMGMAEALSRDLGLNYKKI